MAICEPSRARRVKLAPRGFTYLFVLLTVLLMGAAGALVADVATLERQREREEELLFVGHEFRQALQRYVQAGPAQNRQYPTSLNELLLDPRSGGLRRHLRRIYTDPMTGKAEWGLVRVGGRIVGVHSTSDRAPIKVARFEPDDIGFVGASDYRSWVFTYPPTLLVRPPATSATLPAR